jgi:uncharacterized protein YeaO (DUF488 family)
MAFIVKRAQEPARSSDGLRILVDRLWPRGVSKEKARLDEWMKEIAPSARLRTWFAHEPEKWNEFHHRYHAELKRKSELVARLRKLGAGRRVTLLFATREERYNNAVALKAYLEKR